ncbi:Spy/CpxP family protein refolding chaperone [Gracilimonas mengyeensis]|uniref:Heavy-metal resistance n=1 Tax=Gracilimonas mengyeensis TaxID=1302730 RepID=A0A521E421_9BACT|nr:periplasmic heavy metal sensor [Gracilimonas mengyeensis]SMO78686.1 Heavy-metal resistance [Gracilimonas mengyeensis]
MEYQQKYRWAVTGLVVMILLNAITLGAIWFDRPDQILQEDVERPPRDHMQQFMKKELNLTDAQADTIRTIRGRHFREVRQLMGDLGETRNEYFEAMTNSGQGNSDIKDSLSNELTSRYLQVERMLYRHISEVGNVLDDDQKPRYKELMKETFIRGRHNGKREQRRGHERK